MYNDFPQNSQPGFRFHRKRSKPVNTSMTWRRQCVKGDTETRIPIVRPGVAVFPDKPQECGPERSVCSQGDLKTWPWAGSWCSDPGRSPAGIHLTITRDSVYITCSLRGVIYRYAVPLGLYLLFNSTGSTITVMLWSFISCLSSVVFNLGYTKASYGTDWTLKQASIPALTKIRPRTEVLACQQQAPSSH
jgi:hypothetical protein